MEAGDRPGAALRDLVVTPCGYLPSEPVGLTFSTTGNVFRPGMTPESSFTWSNDASDLVVRAGSRPPLAHFSGARSVCGGGYRDRKPAVTGISQAGTDAVVGSHRSTGMTTANDYTPLTPPLFVQLYGLALSWAWCDLILSVLQWLEPGARSWLVWRK